MVLAPRDPFPRCSNQGFPILSLPWEGPSGEQPVPGAIPQPSAHTWEPELLGGTLLPAASPPPSKPAPLRGAQQPVPSKEPPGGSSNKSTTQIRTHRAPRSLGHCSPRHCWQPRASHWARWERRRSRGCLSAASLYSGIIPGARHTRLTQVEGRRDDTFKERKEQDLPSGLVTQHLHLQGQRNRSLLRGSHVPGPS